VVSAEDGFAATRKPSCPVNRAPPGWEGARRVQDSACDVIISLGGGSAMDAGKAIATIATNGGEPLEFLEVVLTP
jgi:hypothetical protein